jgi:hypothetical protein
VAHNNLHLGIVLTISAKPLDLAPGPLKLLLRLRQMAGTDRFFDTLTSSMATILGVSTNTIRNWREVLVEAGYIHWVTRTCNRMSGWTRIYIRESVEPPSRKAKLAEQRRIDAQPAPLPWQKPKPVVLPPNIKPWWKTPVKTILSLGGAQRHAPIKTSEKKEALEPGEILRLAQKWGLA